MCAATRSLGSGTRRQVTHDAFVQQHSEHIIRFGPQFRLFVGLEEFTLQLNFAANPRWTPRRAIIVSYHLRTFGNSASSTLCRGCRHAQPKIETSAIDASSAKNSCAPSRR